MSIRKMRKQVTGTLSPWNFKHEVGERVLDVMRDKVYDLRQSTGKNKRSMGELTPYLSTPQKTGAKAVKIDGVWYWKRQE